MDKKQRFQDRYTLQRIEDCRRVYAMYGGRQHKEIELEMRRLGHHSFHRRLLYSRFERGRHAPGWVEKYGFDDYDWSKKDWTARGALANAGSSGVTASPDFNYPLDSASERERNSLAAYNIPDKRTDIRPQATSTTFDAFQEWLKRVSPGMDWDFKHQVYLYKKLRRFTDGDCDRMMVWMPPRHGKSEMVTVRYSAWLLREDPSKNIVIASYNQRLANRFSRKIKNVLADDWAMTGPRASRLPVTDKSFSGLKLDSSESPNAGETGVDKRGACGPVGTANGVRPYENGSPFPFASKRRANTDAEWETSHGGGVRAVGVGGGITGFGADVIIVDDPIKSRAEAESATYRDRVWNWFNDDIFTRLEPKGKVCIIQTRWHEDDLCGRLLKEQAEGGEKWEVVDLPALAEAGTRSVGAYARIADASSAISAENPGTLSKAGDQNAGGTGVADEGVHAPWDPLGRKPGEALWPERFSTDVLHRIKLKLGTYSFGSLYQQRPVPADGGLFKRDWFKIIPRAPQGLRWRRATDPGLLSSAKADFTASFRVAFDSENNFYIDGGFRKQLEYPELRRFVLGRMHKEADTIEHGIERSAHGRALEQDLGREISLRGKPLRGIDVRDGKIPRALPWIALAEQGKVFLVRAAWNRDFISECLAFPLGTYDDQIDAVSLGFSMSRRTSSTLHRF